MSSRILGNQKLDMLVSRDKIHICVRKKYIYHYQRPGQEAQYSHESPQFSKIETLFVMSPILRATWGIAFLNFMSFQILLMKWC